jgi:uncharacterized membrane protein YphA (DoxX/SURF4 family)
MPMKSIGRWVYGLGAIGLGVVVLVFHAVSPDWLPIPAHLPGLQLLVWAVGGLLVLAGLAVNVLRAGAVGGLILAALFGLGMAVFEAPFALTHPANWGGWQAVAESVAMALGGVLAWAQAPGGPERPGVLRAARLAFGVCLLIFGGSHFIYLNLTAPLVPAWLPPGQTAWAYITGVAQIAAGLAMLSGVRARLAAVLLTVMYVGFTVLVHIPSVIVAPRSLDNWTENAINLLLIGVAWTAADGLSGTKRPEA